MRGVFLCGSGLLFIVAQLAVIGLFEEGWHQRFQTSISSLPDVQRMAAMRTSVEAAPRATGTQLANVSRESTVLMPTELYSSVVDAQHISIPRHVPCVEFADLDAAFEHCNRRPGDEPRVDCPKAARMERACRLRPSVIMNASCITSDSSAGAHRSRRSLKWSAVVFAIATFNSKKEYELLETAAHTWLPMTSGADLWVAIDVDDPRDDSKVQPN